METKNSYTKLRHKMNYLCAALIIGWYLVFPTITHALTVTIDDLSASGTYISQGGSYSSTFNINEIVSSNPDFYAPYNILGASISISLTDDGYDPFTTRTGTYFEYSGNSYETHTKYKEYRYSAPESARISIGTTTATSSTQYIDPEPLFWEEPPICWSSVRTQLITEPRYRYERVQVGVDEYCSGLNLFGLCIGETVSVPIYETIRVNDGYNHYYSHYYGVDVGYLGDAKYEGVLDSAAMLDLSDDGILNYSIDGLLGDLVVGSAKLTLELSDNPNGVTLVPVPGTILLFFIGLTGLAGISRKLQT